jgi:hypothetical protein
MGGADGEPHWVGPSLQEGPFGPIPERTPAEPRFDYEESKAVNDFLLAAMEVQYRQFAEGEEVPTLADLWQEHSAKVARESMTATMGGNQPTGTDPSFENGSKRFPDFTDLVDAIGRLKTVLPEDHPDIVRLRAAAHEMLQHPELLPQLADFGAIPTESKLGRGNPYEVEPVSQYDQGIPPLLADRLPERQDLSSALQTLDDLLTVPEFNLDALPAADMPMEPMPGLDALLGCVDRYPEPGVLEHMMDQDLFGAMPAEVLEEQMPPEMIEPDRGMHDLLPQDAYGMTPGQEIDQAIDQVAGHMAPEFDPFMMAQQIFDQQMQFMANPFMMPGMMPMGPMLGPAPGM